MPLLYYLFYLSLLWQCSSLPLFYYFPSALSSSLPSYLYNQFLPFFWVASIPRLNLLQLPFSIIATHTTFYKTIEGTKEAAAKQNNYLKQQKQISKKDLTMLFRYWKVESRITGVGRPRATRFLLYLQSSKPSLFYQVQQLRDVRFQGRELYNLPLLAWFLPSVMGCSRT